MSPDGITLTEVISSPLNAKPLSMQLVSQDFLIIALDNGLFQGWTLSTNSLQAIEAHKNGGIITLRKYGDFLLSGDRTGSIQIRSISQQYNLVVPEIKIAQPLSILDF